MEDLRLTSAGMRLCRVTGRERRGQGSAAVDQVASSIRDQAPGGLDLVHDLAPLLTALLPAAAPAAGSAAGVAPVPPADASAAAAAGEGAANIGDAPPPDIEQDVREFLAEQPNEGAERGTLARRLLRRFAATAEAAAALSPMGVKQLLRLAHAVRYSLDVPAGWALVLGELCSDAAAREAQAAAAAAEPLPVDGAAKPPRPPSAGGGMRGQRQIGEAAAGRKPSPEGLALADLLWDGRLWLDRYRASWPPVGAGVLEGEPFPSAAADARYWWGLGRLAEAQGDASTATLYLENCSAALAVAQGGEGPGASPEAGFRGALRLPHCRADGAISEEAIRSKLEVLRLHEIVTRAEEAARLEDHAAVAAALAPAVLCCSEKEAQMARSDARKWSRALRLLLGAAGRLGDWGVALRCHLRILEGALPASLLLPGVWAMAVCLPVSCGVAA